MGTPLPSEDHHYPGLSRHNSFFWIKELTACCNVNVPFLLMMTSSMALIEVSKAFRPSSRSMVVVVTTYVGGAIRFIWKSSVKCPCKCLICVFITEIFIDLVSVREIFVSERDVFIREVFIREMSVLERCLY